MKKVAVIIALLFLMTETTFPTEASVKSKVVDLIKKRKNDSDSNSIEKIASSLKGLGSNFASSGSSQFKYVSGKFLNTDDDLSFLIAYSSFARNSEMFFSLIESILAKIRIEYSSLLSAQNQLKKATTDKAQKKIEESIRQYKNNINRCIEILDSDGLSALNANVQCSSIILLKIVKNEETSPQANQSTIKKQVETFISKYSAAFEKINNDLLSNITTIQKASDSEINIKTKIESVIDNVDLVHNVLKTLKRHISGREISENEIDSYLSNTDYYTTTSENEADNYEDYE